MTRQDHASPVAVVGHGGSANVSRETRGALYTPAERERRDASVWTVVQGVLAPIQFLVFLVSVVLVIRALTTGEGAFAADVSIVAKTALLYLIMVTGSIWEKVVFGRWLFAPAFFWEDVFSMAVLALHTAYLTMLIFALGTLEQRFAVALAGYAAYAVNAAQFLWKLRVARLQGALPDGDSQTSDAEPDQYGAVAA